MAERGEMQKSIHWGEPWGEDDYWGPGDGPPDTLRLWRGTQERTYVAVDALLSTEAMEAMEEALCAPCDGRSDMEINHDVMEAVLAAVSRTTGGAP